MNMCLIWGLQYLIMDTPTHPPKKKANYCDGIVIFRRGRADLLANDKFIQSTSLIISDCCSSCLQITPWIIFR